MHVVVRGIGSDGRPFQLQREYLKYGIREGAEDLCTRQIGYRTRDDAAEAERRSCACQVQQNRFRSLVRFERGWGPGKGPAMARVKRDTLGPTHGHCFV